MELAVLALFSLGGSVVIAYAIWRANKSQVKQYKDSVNQQIWINSARLILDMWKPMENTPFIEASGVVMNHKSFEESDERKELRVRYFNHLTSVTALYYEGILTENHIVGYFGNMLNDLGAHKETVEYLWDPKRSSVYWPLRKWLKEKTGHRLPK